MISSPSTTYNVQAATSVLISCTRFLKARFLSREGKEASVLGKKVLFDFLEEERRPGEPGVMIRL